jgi:hypothetical protein
MQLTYEVALNYTREDLNKMGFTNDEINKIVYPEEQSQ